MQKLLIYFFIAIGLSMDAFSLAIAYGINKLSLKKIIYLSTTVGIFHFIMPQLGGLIGINFLGNLISKSNMIVAIVFMILAIQMFLSRNEDEKVNITNFISILLFSFTVSIDSFSVGVALSLSEKSIISACIIFSIVSGLLTLLGLLLGNKISEKLGKKSTYIGIIILILLSIKYFIN